ncbi:hypothetical protein [Clavibacter capsici]|uniref:hypothetical protein n=1 Tax=Clavibacter capsici TaxID=1874630 RepID=UPI0014287B98|nr:hypothetical protein [Clavibacter capsici]QIS39789.1 hypothetical protein GW572_11830 [Clavibacter capsici]
MHLTPLTNPDVQNRPVGSAVPWIGCRPTRPRLGMKTWPFARGVYVWMGLQNAGEEWCERQ